MACETLNLWTFSGLVGAFLDLGVAYLLLCASSLAFFASKFLGLFGLYLPCPCDSSFLKAKGIRCWKRALVDHSSEKITSVQCSVKGKYPFDSLWDKDPSFRSCFQFTGERNHEISHAELEGEGSSNVIYERRARHLVDRDATEMQEPDFEMECPYVREEESCDLKAKGIENKGRRQILHRRRKVVFDDDNVESVLSNDVLHLDVSDVPQLPTCSCPFGNKDNDESFFSVNSGDGKEVNPDKDLRERAEEDEYSVEDFSYNLPGKLDFDGNERNSIKRLKEALEEERKARNALHVELEKERSAAASAADEAMAMILRLQEEKALVEMESRQYHRMVEDRNVFDAEEMNILKEILLRREMEMHFLEKEVEGYRLTFENDEVIVDANLEDSATERQNVSSSPSRQDSISISREIRKFNGERPGEEILTMQADEFNESFIQEKIMMHRNSEEHPFLNISDETNSKERGMVFAPETSVVSTKVELSSVDLQNKSAKRVAEESMLNSTNQNHELNPARSLIETISLVHDVHVIDQNAGEVLPMDVAPTETVKCGSASLWRSNTEREITRNNWDLTSGLQTKASSEEKGLVSALRRNSMSAVDCERLKLGNEVGLLMERLKVVQVGREKLNFPIKHKETETNLERHQWTALQTAQRRAASPPTPKSSKVMPKKRGCRSSSLSIHRST